jgi:hypothetical protein
MKPFFWLAIRIGNWKFESGKFYRYTKKTAVRSPKTTWMQWERIYLFGPPPD